jgi:beta-xylosidase|tara:strand:- start:443 stop:658 length:216 start_codon:yes stop_codon:yes gene_type:complete
MEEQNKITINDKEYDYVELEENQQYYVNQVRNLKARIAESKFNLDQLVAAEDAFSKALIASFQEELNTDEA